MKKLFLTLILVLIALPQLKADKGMWLLQLMRQQNLEDRMRKLGLRISVDEIYSPNAPSLKDAIGIFGGGCTGEVVSPNGLVVTNHHCGFSFIQQLSSVEHNYLQNGFWSQSNDEELPCEGLGFTFVVNIKDVTNEINSRVADGKITVEQSFNRGGRGVRGRDISKPTCQVCDKYGHSAKQYYHRFNMSYSGESTSKNSDASTYVATPKKVSDPDWYMDSGATNHITHQDV